LQQVRKNHAAHSRQEHELYAQLAEEERCWEGLKQELAAVAKEERDLKVALKQMQETSPRGVPGDAAAAADLADVAKQTAILREELRGLRADAAGEEEELAQLRSEVLMQRELMERLERDFAEADIQTSAMEYQLPR